jgi:hypothetical protein
LLTDLFDSRASHEQIDAWDSGVAEDYPFLQTYALEPYMNDFPNRSFANYGDYLEYHGMNYGGVRDVACARDYFDTHVAATLGDEGKDADPPLTCNCGGARVCGDNGENCSIGSDVDEGADGGGDSDDPNGDGGVPAADDDDGDACSEDDENCQDGVPVPEGSDDSDEDEDDEEENPEIPEKLRTRDQQEGSQHTNHLVKRAGGKPRTFYVKFTSPDGTGTDFNHPVTSWPVSTFRM